MTNLPSKCWIKWHWYDGKNRFNLSKWYSPSGCTFWGKRPWSRKKKLMWQLGILIGAPLGIILLAAISVPLITIGLPIWTARKVFIILAFISSLKQFVQALINQRCYFSLFCNFSAQLFFRVNSEIQKKHYNFEAFRLGFCWEFIKEIAVLFLSLRFCFWITRISYCEQ